MTTEKKVGVALATLPIVISIIWWRVDSYKAKHPELQRRQTVADASAEVIDLRGKSGITTLFVLPGQRSAWYRFNPGVDFKISHGETRLRVYTQGVWKAGVEEGPGQNLPAPENSKYDEKDRTFSFLGVEKVPVEVTLRWEPAQ